MMMTLSVAVMREMQDKAKSAKEDYIQAKANMHRAWVIDGVIFIAYFNDGLMVLKQHLHWAETVTPDGATRLAAIAKAIADWNAGVSWMLPESDSDDALRAAGFSART